MSPLILYILKPLIRIDLKVDIMGKLRFYYGAMNSLKTGTLLTKVYQFEQCGCNTIILKPSFDTRDSGVIKSRAISESRECHTFDYNTDLYLLINTLKRNAMKNVVFIDEVNFIQPEQVHHLWEASKELDIDVFAYGLKTNYKNELFEASKKLLILADTVEEIKSMCSYCHNKATTHLRYVDGIPILNGDSCIVGDIDGSERYESVCQSCWHKAHGMEIE